MSNDKLTEALRIARGYMSDAVYDGNIVSRKDARLVDDALAAHAAEAAQAQAQSAEWVLVPREPTEGMLKAAEDAVDASSNCESTTDDLSAIAYKAALAAAPQPQAAESIKRVIEQMNTMRWAGFSDVPLKVVANWATDLSVAIGEIPFDGVAHDAHPQPAQDAKDSSLYQGLLMAVGKKFPGEGRHETALRYIREAEYKSPESKCDAAMAKESGQ